jgi:RNA polymerase sigma-70 factor (ECF subfamily)
MTSLEFNLIVDQYSDNVYRFIYKNIRDKDKAKDIIQDTYEKLWRKVDDVAYDKAKSYLFTAAYHTMIDVLRRDKKQVRFDSINKSSYYESNEFTGAKEIIDKVVQNLPDIQRSVVMLRDYEGYSYKEITEITGLTEDQVKVYIYRARVYLKENLKSVDLII